MKSMTGFGRVDYRDEDVDFSIEIKTINHRFRDFFIKMPKALNPIEEKIKKTISEKIGRGRIEVYIKYIELGSKNQKIVFNRDLAVDYIGVLNKIRHLDSMIGDDLSLSLIAKFPDVIYIEESRKDTNLIWGKIQPVLQQVVDEVEISRKTEGENLKDDVLNRRLYILAKTEEISKKSPEMIDKYREELKNKIAVYLDSAEIDEQRILTEVAIMSDKLNIDEELTRIKSHMNQLGKIVLEDEPIGRKLDFLIQEINREINTIGSKSNSLEIANNVVEIKSEIEKIREQIQNIE